MNIGDKMANQLVSKKRRKLLNGVAGVTALGAAAPSSWTKPIVNAVVLPAHAGTSDLICSFSIEKTQSGGPNPATMAGDIIEYTILVTNTGTGPLTEVVATDTMPDGTVIILTDQEESLAADNVLEVDEEWTYETTYEVTQDDIDSGEDLLNTVVVGVAEVPEQQDDAAETPVVPQVECPAIIVGEVTRSGGGSGFVSCSMSFTFFSDTTTPLDITDISFTDLPAEIGEVTLVDGTTFEGATDSMGPEVTIAFTAEGAACVELDAITITGDADITFTVEAECENGVAPISMDFDLSTIAGLI